MPRKTPSTQPAMTAMTVFEWARRSRRAEFTTNDVAAHFDIPATRAAAFIAILRIKNLLTSPRKSIFAVA
jgi:hypothetical protein